MSIPIRIIIARCYSVRGGKPLVELSLSRDIYLSGKFLQPFVFRTRRRRGLGESGPVTNHANKMLSGSWT